MTLEQARSVKLYENNLNQQLSTQTKASDIIFRDGVDLQTKWENGLLVDRNSLSWVNAISPVVTVVRDTDTEFRLQIKAINGTITTPNLKGATVEELTAQIQGAIEELEERIDYLPDGAKLEQDLAEIRDNIQTNADSITMLTDTVGDINDWLSTVSTKAETNRENIQDIRQVLDTKADKTEIVDAYSKTEVNQKLALKADASTVYTKEQIDAKVPEFREYDNIESFPNNGQIGKLYIDKEENFIYRWNSDTQEYDMLGLRRNIINDCVVELETDEEGRLVAINGDGTTRVVMEILALSNAEIDSIF